MGSLSRTLWLRLLPYNPPPAVLFCSAALAAALLFCCWLCSTMSKAVRPCRSRQLGYAPAKENTDHKVRFRLQREGDIWMTRPMTSQGNQRLRIKTLNQIYTTHDSRIIDLCQESFEWFPRRVRCVRKPSARG